MSRGKKTQLHPISRFRAPAAIEHGKALKLIFNETLVALIGESISAVYPKFDEAAFVEMASLGLDKLEFKQRSEWIARALIEQLPTDFPTTAQILIRSFGPELTQTAGNGMAVFFYMPHAQVIATLGTEHFSEGMRANYELTKRFTAEFSVRPFLVEHPSKCLALLTQWTQDPNPHVRRLTSEGTRPRLPWAMRLPTFQRDPSFTLPLLELLKDDGELYVRRSVANHLADILKDNPDAGYQVCANWLDELRSPSLDSTCRENRQWIIRHALRLPAKKGDSHALQLRQRAR